jgi:two-component system chemotaxis response regulator CheY
MAFNLLIVDDSSSMRAVIEKAVKVSGFSVRECWEAADGKEALKVLRSEWVDLVLADIIMPNMNGLELITEMKKDQLLQSIPVIMVTTEGGEKRIQEAMKLGASGYMKKPFLPEDIKRTLDSIIGNTEDGQKANDEDYERGDF